MKERPILFTGDMVRAIIDGRKTQTRRLSGLEQINFNPDIWINDAVGTDDKERFTASFESTITGSNFIASCPYGQPGDILWVRETWRKYNLFDENGYFGADIIDFAADNPEPMVMHDGDGFQMYNKKGQEKMIPFRPSIHMPKSAARIWLQVTDIRVERVQDISEADARAEGAEKGIFRMGPNVEKGEFQLELNHHARFVEGFKFIWHQVNGAESWDDNPWVWVITFRVLSTTGRPAKFPALCEAL